MKSIKCLLFVLVILNFSLFAQAKQPSSGIPVFYSYGGEKIIKVMDLPDTSDFQGTSGEFIDIGYIYKQVTVFFIPVANYDKRWCGYIGSKTNYLRLDREELSRLAERANLQFPQKPFLWDSILGDIFVIITILFIYYRQNIYRKPTKEQSEKKTFSEVPYELQDTELPDSKFSQGIQEQFLQKQEQETISKDDKEDSSMYATNNLENQEKQGQNTFWEEDDVSISINNDMKDQILPCTDRHGELRNPELAPKFIPGNEIPMDSISRTFTTLLGSIFGMCAGFFIFAGMVAIHENIGATVGMVLLGVIIGIMAYRLITDYGAKPEGGMLSCTAYAILGGIFVALAIWGSVTLITKGKRWDDALWGVSWLIILSSWCFSTVWLRRKKRMLLLGKNHSDCQNR